jgi:hypothetical protein
MERFFPVRRLAVISVRPAPSIFRTGPLGVDFPGR